MEQPLPLREIDQYFADFLSRLAADSSEELRRVAACLSAAVGRGDICLDLGDAFGAEAPALTAALHSSPLVGLPGARRPLVLTVDGQLYLYRYWRYESELATALTALAAGRPPLDMPALQTALARLFTAPAGETDWQKLAAAAAVRSRFAVISGGPGTGKTSTVVKIIALLLAQPGGENCRIALAAPTGKAAARLKEALHAARLSLWADESLPGIFPEDVATIHRLLGVIPGSCRFRHDSGNPLPWDVVIIDEASMVPLPLLAKVVAALTPQTRLILLGDRDQLSSVEAGAVLGDICAAGEEHAFSAAFADFAVAATGAAVAPELVTVSAPRLADNIIVLRKNYRFGAGSGIGALSADINAGAGPAALDRLIAEGYPEVRLRGVPVPGGLEAQLADLVVAGYRDYLQAQEPATALELFDRFRVLCALRQGSYGVDGINPAIERCLSAAGLISPRREWYHGRPVMIVVNDYGRRLFNGDIGITLADPDNEGRLAVYFRATTGGIRKFSPYRLPPHETVYAMTVHKSQGSELERLLLIMPVFDSQLLTREILYTGITRAKKAVELWCTAEIFLATVARRISRRSGLRRALWGESCS